MLTGPAWSSPLGHSSEWYSLTHGFSQTGRRSTWPSWANWQYSEILLQQNLRQYQSELAPFVGDHKLRDESIDRFYRYAYQWY